MADPIVVRLTQAVLGYPVGAEFGFTDATQATSILGAGTFEVVREQDGDLLTPPTPEELEQWELDAIVAARARRLITGADFDSFAEQVTAVEARLDVEHNSDGTLRDVARAYDISLTRRYARRLTSPAPTITEQTAGATGGGFLASTIASPSPRYSPHGAQFRYSGAVEAGTGTSVETGSKRGLALTQAGTRGTYNVDFETDADVLEIHSKGGSSGTAADVLVNGELIRATPLTPTLTTGAFYTWKIDFGGNTDPKHIRIESSGTFYFSGITIPATATVWRSAKPLGPRVTYYTDSIGGTAGISAAADKLRTIPRVISEHVGWANYGISATGSTGFANPGNSATFEARMDADLKPYDPEILVLIVGQNDAGAYASQSEAAARSFFTTLFAWRPNLLVYLIGPYTESATVLGGHATVRDGYVAVAQEFPRVVHIDPLGGGAEGAVDTGWITTANRSIAIGGDALHPTRRGAGMWGSRAASAIEAATS